MSDLHAELLSTALVGTDRRPADLTGVTGPLGTALAAVRAEDPAVALLEAAALSTTYRRAGVRPAREVPRPAPAPDDARPQVPPAAAHRLSLLLDSEASAVLLEWLEVAAGRGMRAPAGLLPRMLDRARSETVLRAPVLSAGGPRMRWLAAQNPHWHYLSRVSGAAATLDVTDWELGDAGRRLDYLTALRADDPAAARQLLNDAWRGEEPLQRAALLETLEVGVSDADEQFLETALADRRKEVRRVAATLLNQLPDSAYTRRMAERARGCVSLDGKKVRFQPPTEFDDTMRRDGLPMSETTAGQCLDEILNATPLCTWRGLGPPLATLLDKARGKDADRLTTALSVAAVRESDVDVATMLLSWRGATRYRWLPGRLLPVLPVADRCRLVAAGLSWWTGPDHQDNYQLLGSCPRPWSPALGRAALKHLTKHASRLGYRVYQWSELLGERLPVELLAEAVALGGGPGHSDASTGLGRLGELADIRQQLHQEFG